MEIEQKAKEIDMKMHRVWKCDCCGADFGDKEECQKHEDGCWEKKYAGWAEKNPAKYKVGDWLRDECGDVFCVEGVVLSQEKGPPYWAYVGGGRRHRRVEWEMSKEEYAGEEERAKEVLEGFRGLGFDGVYKFNEESGRFEIVVVI